MQYKIDLHERGLYLPVLFAIPALAGFGHYIGPGEQIFKGHNWGIVVTFVGLAIAGGLWLTYRSQSKWSLIPRLVLLLLVGGWAYQLISIQLDDSLFAISAGALLLAVLLIWIKPPKADDVRLAGLTLGFSILAISIVSLTLGGMGILPDGFNVADSGFNRLIPTRELLGIDTRWGGPFGSVNLAAPAGGLLVMIGLLYRRWVRWLFVLSGITILSLSQGRTAIIATVLAVVVFIAWSQLIAQSPRPRITRAGILAVTLGVVMGYVVVSDPTLSGRTPIWQEFWQQFLSAPLFGVGESGVRNYLDALLVSQPGRFPHNHAHNVLLDLLVKYGIVPALLLLAVYVLAAVTTFKGIRDFGPAPFAIVVFVIAEGFAETVYSLAYWSIHIAVLLLAVMWVSIPVKQSHTDRT
jgi:O-antigen ligase